MNQIRATHRLMSRLTCGLWGGVIGFSLPFIINILFHAGFSPDSLTWFAYPAMLLLAWVGQHTLYKLLLLKSVEYTTQTITTGLRIKAVFFAIIIASVVFTITPVMIKSMQYSILPPIVYIISLSMIAWLYGVQLLIIKPMPRSLLKALIVGFNCFSWQNAISLILASFYYSNYTNPDKFLKFASFQYLTFMIYPLIVGMFLSMLVYYFNNKQ